MRSVEILLDRPRRLRFDYNAIAEFETVAPGGFASMMTERHFAAIRLALWAGLKHEERGLTLERTGDIIQRYIDQYEGDGSPLTYLGEVVLKAMRDSGLLKDGSGKAEEPTTPTASESSVPLTLAS